MGYLEDADKYAQRWRDTRYKALDAIKAVLVQDPTRWGEFEKQVRDLTKDLGMKNDFYLTYKPDALLTHLYTQARGRLMPEGGPPQGFQQQPDKPQEGVGGDQWTRYQNLQQLASGQRSSSTDPVGSAYGQAPYTIAAGTPELSENLEKVFGNRTSRMTTEIARMVAENEAEKLAVEWAKLGRGEAPKEGMATVYNKVYEETGSTDLARASMMEYASSVLRLSGGGGKAPSTIQPQSLRGLFGGEYTTDPFGNAIMQERQPEVGVRELQPGEHARRIQDLEPPLQTPPRQIETKTMTELRLKREAAKRDKGAAERDEARLRMEREKFESEDTKRKHDMMIANDNNQREGRKLTDAQSREFFIALTEALQPIYKGEAKTPAELQAVVAQVDALIAMNLKTAEQMKNVSVPTLFRGKLVWLPIETILDSDYGIKPVEAPTQPISRTPPSTLQEVFKNAPITVGGVPAPAGRPISQPAPRIGRFEKGRRLRELTQPLPSDDYYRMLYPRATEDELLQIIDRERKRNWEKLEQLRRMETR